MRPTRNIYHFDKSFIRMNNSNAPKILNHLPSTINPFVLPNLGIEALYGNWIDYHKWKWASPQQRRNQPGERERKKNNFVNRFDIYVYI